MSHAASIDHKRDGGDHIPALDENPCLRVLREKTEEARSHIEYVCRGGGKEQQCISAVTNAIHGLSLRQFERFSDLIHHVRKGRISTVEQGLHWLIKNDPSTMSFAKDVGMLYCKWSDRHREDNADSIFMNELAMIARGVYPSGADTILRKEGMNYLPVGYRIMLNIAGYPVEAVSVRQGLQVNYPDVSEHHTADDSEKVLIYSHILRPDQSVLVGRPHILHRVFDETFNEPQSLEPECNVRNISFFSRVGLLIALCEEGAYFFDRISTNVAYIQQMGKVTVSSCEDTQVIASDQSGIHLR